MSTCAVAATAPAATAPVAARRVAQPRRRSSRWALRAVAYTVAGVVLIWAVLVAFAWAAHGVDLVFRAIP